MVSARFLRPVLFFAFPLSLGAQDNDPPARAGRVSSVAGTVALQAAGTPDWATTPLNYTVSSGDRLLTHQRSRAELEVGPFDVRLADSTDLSVVHLTDDFTQLGLNRGTIRVAVYRLASRDSMEVDTPNGAIIIRSAGRYRVDVLEGVSTIVTVEDGVAELSGPALDYTVRRGQSIELTGSNAINANMVPHPRNTDFDQWSADRDRRQENATYTRYMSRDIPGGSDLDHHGRWHYHASYGYVWQPTVVSVGWVPYRHGRWVWSNVWGWTWVESVPWGYAPFHYGRWVVVGGAWAWAPGPIIRRPYYAPALVVFVGGPRHHQAWFPLGWREPYYPRYRHSDRYLREVNIANVRGIANVNEFVDTRRADRIQYSNRQATTVVSTEVFGRRPVTHNAANFKPDEVSRAPIVRDRWESPRVANPATPNEPASADRPSPFRQRRDVLASPDMNAPTRMSEPTRTAEPDRADPVEPRRQSPLIFRNSPPTVGRRPSGQEDAARPTMSVPRSAQNAPPSNRPRPLIRRNEPSEPSAGGEPMDRSRRTILQRGGESAEVNRPAPRASTPPPSNPRESSPRTSSPRQSGPRRSEPRQSAPRQSEPQQSEPRGRAPSVVTGSVGRMPSRRPPA